MSEPVASVPVSLPVYNGDFSAYPEIDESALESVGVGLYRVTGKSRRGDFFDPKFSEWRCDAEQVMFARVDDGANARWLPTGQLRAEIRPDGKRLVVGWTL